MSYAVLAGRLQVSQSQAYTSAVRADRARLLVRSRERTALEPLTDNILEFLVHGVRYAFPAEPGPITRGLPTLHGAPLISDRLVTEATPPVWPTASGKARGEALEPLHKSVTHLAMTSQNPRDYAAFAAVDLIRVGGARERKIGQAVLQELLRHPNDDPHAGAAT